MMRSRDPRSDFASTSLHQTTTGGAARSTAVRMVWLVVVTFAILTTIMVKSDVRQPTRAATTRRVDAHLVFDGRTHGPMAPDDDAPSDANIVTTTVSSAVFTARPDPMAITDAVIDKSAALPLTPSLLATSGALVTTSHPIPNPRSQALGCDRDGEPAPPWLRGPIGGGTPFFQYEDSSNPTVRWTSFDNVKAQPDLARLQNARVSTATNRGVNAVVFNNALSQQRELNRRVLAVAASVPACASPENPKVVVVDFWVSKNGDPVSREGLLAMWNHEMYASAHGYAYRHVNTTVHPPGMPFEYSAYFGKLAAVHQLLHEFEWVFYLDLDAVVIDLSRRIEHVLEVSGVTITGKEMRTDAAGHDNNTTVDLFFSGDTNLINSGVMLYHRSAWMDKFLSDALRIGLDERALFGGHKIGMGGENAALSILLGGCSAGDAKRLLQKCYARVDAYDGDHITPDAHRVMRGDASVLNKFGVPASVQQHIRLLPQAQWQTHHLLQAFVLHYPGGRHSDDITFKSGWLTAKKNNRPHKMLAIMEAVYGKVLD